MNKNKFLGRASLLFTAFIWGTSFVVQKSALDNISALWILAVRFTIATLMMLALINKGVKKIDKKTLLRGVALGLSLGTAYIVQTYGLCYTTPGKNAFLTGIYCVMVPFMAWMAFKKRPSVLNVLAAVLCVAGIGFVSLNGDKDINIGDMLTLICAVFYAVQIILLESFSKKSDTSLLTGIQFFTVAMICWIGVAVTRETISDVPVSTWLRIAYLGIMCTGVCFFLQGWGMRYTPAAEASLLMSMESVFATLISVLFFNEALTVQIAVGFVFILAAIIVSEVAPQLLSKNKVKAK